jgi:hypothetical protein
VRNDSIEPMVSDPYRIVVPPFRMGDMAICIRFGLSAYYSDFQHLCVLADGDCSVQRELAGLLDRDSKVVKLLGRADYHEFLNSLTRGPYSQFYSHRYSDTSGPYAGGFVGHVGVALDGLLLPMLGSGIRIYDLYRALFRLGSRTPLMSLKVTDDSFKDATREVCVTWPNDYVLIIPEANTVPHTIINWESVRTIISKLGFTPIFDTANGNELFPNLGRRLTLSELLYIASKCRLTISVRSGATDLFSIYRLKQLIFYPPGNYFSMFSLGSDSPECTEIICFEDSELERAITNALIPINQTES